MFTTSKMVRGFVRSAERPRLRFECLEGRHLLAAAIASNLRLDEVASNGAVPAELGDLNWFQSFDATPRVALSSLSKVDPDHPTGFIGPKDLATGEWIVRLSETSTDSVRRLSDIESWFDTADADFTLISGLGSPGLILVRGRGDSQNAIETSLADNPRVESFGLNSLIEGQATLPNDSDYTAGLLPGLDTIAAPEAWDISRGSTRTVVGVVDSGIDVTHPDLYLNIWINQGEIPAELFAELTDIDGDGLITFYDLNHVIIPSEAPFYLTSSDFATGPNASLVIDLNGNSRIDAIDLLQNPLWADGRDTDGNGFFDDLFGVNFRAGASDPYSSNNPSDELGHGTHVAGTIGAIGGNGIGVAGINWHTSLMSLRILDNRNQSDAGAGLRAVNYARMMRERYEINDAGRITAGANVRVLNNSWGQPGGFESAFESAIDELGQLGVMFVAAAGNGDILGNGVNNDSTPFYPAGYELDNVIAVAASNGEDRLASFSNYGKSSVDLAAPGVGIRSTLRGGGYGTANGTSMASPHVAATAALIWSALPESTVAEVRKAILSSVDPIASGTEILASTGRLNLDQAMHADVFAPAAELLSKQDVTTSGGSATTFVVEFSHPSGMNLGPLQIGGQIQLTREWGPADNVSVSLVGFVPTATGAIATYEATAPGNSWDPLDYGDYAISTVANSITSLSGRAIESRRIGSFNVRIADPSVIYVDHYSDELGSGSLRDAIIAANAASSSRTIILNAGTYRIEIPYAPDPSSTFSLPVIYPYTYGRDPAPWSNEQTGDFDIRGQITIVGHVNDETIVDAQGLDRVFKVYPDASLELRRITATGGISPAGQGGGGILSAGELYVGDSNIRDNVALGVSADDPIRGGGIAVWDGTAVIERSWIDGNESNYGGGIFFADPSDGVIRQSTISNGLGGGIHSHSDNDVDVDNTTISANRGGRGAVFHGKRDGFDIANGNSFSASVSADGRYVAYESSAQNLVEGDTNLATDVFIYDSFTGQVRRWSTGLNGSQANGGSYNPSIGPTGNFVVFESYAGNLVNGDTNNTSDIFFHYGVPGVNRRISETPDFLSPNGRSFLGSSNAVSGSGQYIVYASEATNLVTNDFNATDDIFLYDQGSRTTTLVSRGIGGTSANGRSTSPTISLDGRFVAYSSLASDLVSGDTNSREDVFVYDRVTQTTERVSVQSSGLQVTGSSQRPSLSSNGRFVSFSSIAADLVAGDSDTADDVFVFDRVTRQTSSISVRSTGPISLFAAGAFYHPEISGDGNVVTFVSNAIHQGFGSPPGLASTYLYNRVTDTLDWISQPNPSAPPNTGSQGSTEPSISFNGLLAAYESSTSNLIVGDVNGRSDIFAFGSNLPQLTSATTAEVSTSTMHVRQLTIAETFDARFSVHGKVNVDETLFTKELLATDSQRVLLGNIVPPNDPDGDLVGPLTRVGNSPPVHPLLSGNPAIDAGSPLLAGTVDQLGQVRLVPDIGAHEAVLVSVSGMVFVDQSSDQVRQTNEPGVPGIPIEVLNPATSAVVRSTVTSSVGTVGSYELAGLPLGSYDFRIAPPVNWSFSLPNIRRVPTTQPEQGFSWKPAISADGKIVAFESSASNLVPGDTNGVRDVFVYEIETGLLERISVTAGGAQTMSQSYDVTISGDGRYVAFLSSASDLVSDDTNNQPDIFVRDRQTDTTRRVNVSSTGVQANGSSSSPYISRDGSTVVYASLASNLVANDTNNSSDIFAINLNTNQVRRTSVRTGGLQGTGISVSPSVNANGTQIAFWSNASLVPNDTNNFYDLFIHDTQTLITERVNVANDGSQANAGSSSGLARASLSNDGRFVAFTSLASNLVPNDTNDVRDVFVVDRNNGSLFRASVDHGGNQLPFYSGGILTGASLSGDGRFLTFESIDWNYVSQEEDPTIDVFIVDLSSGPASFTRLSTSRDGIGGNGISSDPSLSADGRYVIFGSDASSLVEGDTNEFTDLFLTPNPLIEPGLSRELRAGDVLNDLNFGLIPDPGRVSGVLFDDLVPNGIRDTGESGLSGWTVFLDANENDVIDEDEVTSVSGSDGSFQLFQVPGFREYRIVVRPREGWETSLSQAELSASSTIQVPAGGDIAGRDFGFRRVTGTGQSTNSTLGGRVYDDLNGNGVYDLSIDLPRGGISVYLDANNDSIRNLGADEPVVVTDSQGHYTFGGLGSRIVAVRTLLDETIVHTSPLGSRFTNTQFELFDDLLGFQDPQAAIDADFNDDGFPDLGVLVSDRNTLAIRLNDGTGAFPASSLDIDLAPAAGVVGISFPRSLVAGQFNGASTGQDVAIVGFGSRQVMVLLDFDPVSGTFASRSTYTVGANPIDIAVGDVNNNGSVDLIVVNQGIPRITSYSPLTYLKDGDETFQVLLNNGSGSFTPSVPIAVPGDNPSGIAVADFDNDQVVDVAILQPTPTGGTPFGDVALFLNNGSGTFTRDTNAYPVKAQPTDIIAGDFNGDGRPDLAVANAGSTSITILTGASPSGLQVSSALIGTNKGIDRMRAGDIDGDGDLDIVASRLDDTNVAIFRNVTPAGGAIAFEPLEALGLGSLDIADRSPIVLADFDLDDSGPNQAGTIDIVAIPRSTTRINVLLNRFVNGAHRVALTGTNSISDLDFRTTPAILPPWFDAISNPAPLDEDDGQQSIMLTGIVKGRSDGPPLQFSTSSTAPGIITGLNVVYGGGSQATLNFQPVANANGSVEVTVRAVNAGANGIFNDGDDGIFERSFTVTVDPVNDAPEFDLLGSITVNQKSGPQTQAGFATNITPGGGTDEASQVLSGFSIVTNSTLFSSPPSINAAGTLTFTPNPNQFGLAVVRVTLADSGGTANGGADRLTDFFAINILPVNDPPSINVGDDIQVMADEGLQTHPDFATGFQPGVGADDATQLISNFLVSTDMPTLFSVAPDIDNGGTLTFTPRPSAAGTATVTVMVQDNGGTLNGGVDQSVAKTFRIIVLAASPTIEFVQIDNGLAQRSTIEDITITFASEVEVQPDAFSLTRLGVDGGQVGSVTAETANAIGRTLVRLSFSGAHTQNGSLADGHYQLQIDAEKVTANGQLLNGGSGPGSDYVDEFFRLFGDQDGNRVVNLLDFAGFRSAFGNAVLDSPMFEAFDFNQNQVVDLLDFAAFRRNYSKSI